MAKILTIFIFFLFSISTPAQRDTTIALGEDTIAPTKIQKKAIYSSARRASILSAALPGLGQAYNKKFWKIPVIYAGLGGFGYMFFHNNKQYNFYRKNVRAYYDDDSTTVNTLPQYSGDQLQTEKLYFRKYRDFAVIGFTLIYLINIIDANVDAHLRTFDVSDDLSLNIDPWQSTYRLGGSFRTAMGVSVKLNFK